MLRLVLVILVTMSAASCASMRAAGEEVAWTPFRWVPVTVAGKTQEHAAILVPFRADTLGGTYWLQLDTGADTGIWIYAAPLRQLLGRRGVAPVAGRAMSVNATVGAYAVRDEAINQRSHAGDTVSAGDPAPKIGTLGLNFFRRRVLLLDLPGQRFAILDSAALPASLERRASWVPVELRNDKMFVPLTLNGRVYDDFFYDSGASLFAISTTPEVWREATGRTGSEPDNVDWTVPSFGQQVVLRGAPARGAVSVGAATLERPLIFHLAQGPERLDPRNWGFRTSGLVGNALFAERYMVIVDLPRRRFGLVDQRAR